MIIYDGWNMMEPTPSQVTMLQQRGIQNGQV